MRIKALITIGFLAFATLAAASRNELKNTDFSKGMKYWIAGKYPHKVVDGKFVADIPAGCDMWAIILCQSVKLKPGKHYKLSYTLETEKNGVMRQVYQLAQNPWSSIGLCKDNNVVAGKQTCSFMFTANEDFKDNQARITFNLSRLRGQVRLSDLRLEEVANVDYILNPSWTLFNDVIPPDTFDSIPDFLKGSMQSKVSAQKVELKNNRINLAKLNGGSIKPDMSIAVLYNKFESSNAGLMKIGVSADWYIEVYLNGEKVFKGVGSPDFSTADNQIDLPVKAGRNLLAVKVKSGSRGWMFVCGKNKQPVKIQAGTEWKAPLHISGNIEEGSALDFSAYMGNIPAGKSGRLVIAENGTLVFEKNKNKPVRLLGFNGIASGIFDTEDDKIFKTNAVTFARLARRQGYSLFRVHGLLDYWLCKGSTKDMAINPKYLDRWDYLISELKKEGIYIHMVMFSFGLYSRDYLTTHDSRDQHKLMMFLDGKWEMERFRYAADTLFNHINPYTGKAWKDDPVIAFVEYYNEQSIAIGRIIEVIKQNPGIRKVIEKYWREWLIAKYPDIVPKELSDDLKGKNLKDAELPLHSRGALANEFPLFWMDRAIICAKQCEEIVRKAGYSGLVSSDSASKKLGISAVRWATSQVIDVHSYFNHPSNWTNKGSRIAQNSSIGDCTGYWRGMNSTKLTGRPFIVGEYNHCFWNPYRYEGGMVFAGYSALQGYGAIMIHSDPVLPDIKRLFVGCFSCGTSPIIRASQFLSACIFGRGDLRTSSHHINLVVPEKYLKSDGNAGKAVSSDQSKLGLLCGFGISFPWLEKPATVPSNVKSDLNILPSGAAAEKGHGWFTEIVDSSDSEFSLDNTVIELKKRGILSTDNVSKPSKGIFQSDTGEITLRSKDKFMKIVSEKTAGMCITAGNSETAGILKVKNSSVDCCAAVCSVDDKPLSSSSRIVMIYSTEEANSNMKLSHNRASLFSLGTPPLLLRVGKISAELEVRNANEMSLYALGIDGTRLEKLPVKSINGQLIIEIDTATLKKGPSVFFEIVKE